MLTVAYDHDIFARQAYGGISRYFCEVACEIDRTPDARSKIFAPVHFNGHLAAHAAPKLACFLPLRVPKSARLYGAINACISPMAIAAYGPDVVHRTYYSGGPRPRRAKLVVTVFDMIHELYPQQFSKFDKSVSDKRRAVTDADAVVCISRSTARDLQRLLDVPAAKIAVTHLGCSSAFEPAHTPAGVVARNGRPFLLHVGGRAGYKNFTRLLVAYASSPRLARDFDLVAFGGHPFDDAEVAQILALRLQPGTVRHLTGSDEDLVRAYGSAHAFVFPSEYEGFGIPPLEAMSAGCPVICSEVSSIPEVVGDAGEYFDPLDTDSIRSAIERVAYDDDRRTSLIGRGHVRRMGFSWERCANETLRVYRSLLR